MISLVLAAHAGPVVGSGALSSVGSGSKLGESSATLGTETDDAEAAAGSIELGDAAAAIVLGETVDTVARPSSAADLAISLGGAFEDGEVPTSYAVEISPFWLGKRAAEVGFRDHVGGGAPSLARNLNVSFAARNNSDDGIGAALAVRTTWWAPPGGAGRTAASRFVRDYDAIFADPTGVKQVPVPAGGSTCLRSLSVLSDFLADVGPRVARKLATAAQAKALAAQTSVLEACGEVDPVLLPGAAAVCGEAGFATGPRRALAPDPALDTREKTRIDERVAAMKRAQAAAETDLTTQVKEVLAELKKDPTKLGDPLEEYLTEVGFAEAFEGCDALLTRHQGWVVDFGAGASIASPDTTLTGLGGDAVHAWLTPGWVGDHESVFVFGRFKVDDLAGAPAPGVDVGLGLGYRWSRWALEAQGLVGLPILGRDAAARLTVGADVLLSKGLWFTTAVGGTLPPDEPGSFLTLAGVKLAVTRERTFQTPTYGDLVSVLP